MVQLTLPQNGGFLFSSTHALLPPSKHSLSHFGSATVLFCTMDNNFMPTVNIFHSLRLLLLFPRISCPLSSLSTYLFLQTCWSCEIFHQHAAFVVLFLAIQMLTLEVGSVHYCEYIEFYNNQPSQHSPFLQSVKRL